MRRASVDRLAVNAPRIRDEVPHARQLVFSKLGSLSNRALLVNDFFAARTRRADQGCLRGRHDTTALASSLGLRSVVIATTLSHWAVYNPPQNKDADELAFHPNLSSSSLGKLHLMPVGRARTRRQSFVGALAVASLFPVIATPVGSGWVSSQSARAAASGSTPVFLHHELSSPQ